MRGELRRDWSDERFFTGPRGSDDRRTGQNTVLIGLVWWMGNKTGDLVAMAIGMFVLGVVTMLAMVAFGHACEKV